MFSLIVVTLKTILKNLDFAMMILFFVVNMLNASFVLILKPRMRRFDAVVRRLRAVVRRLRVVVRRLRAVVRRLKAVVRRLSARYGCDKRNN